MPSSLGRDGEPQRHVFFREKHGLQLGNRGEDMSPAACPPQVEPGCVCVIALEFLPGSLWRQRGSGTCGGGVGAPGGGGAESRAQVRREGAQAHWRSTAPRPPAEAQTVARPRAGWWPCFHTRQPLSADKKINGHKIKALPARRPPMPADLGMMINSSRGQSLA